MNTNFFINPDNSVYKQIQDFNTDHYYNLEKELQSLSESDVSAISNFQPYIEANSRLSMLVQAELLNLVKGKLNGNPEVINNVIGAIREYKRTKENELDEFKDYMTNFPELTYKEYKELKYGKG
jgi:hypothetical protein